MIKVRKIKTEPVLVLGLCVKRDCWWEERPTWEIRVVINYVHAHIIILENYRIFYPLKHFFSQSVFSFLLQFKFMPQIPSWKSPLSNQVKISDSEWIQADHMVSCLFHSFIHACMHACIHLFIHPFTQPANSYCKHTVYFTLEYRY